MAKDRTGQTKDDRDNPAAEETGRSNEEVTGSAEEFDEVDDLDEEDDEEDDDMSESAQ